MRTKLPLQSAKATRPVVRGAVPRPRLFRLLDAMCERHPGVWVQAPPGAGKTVLAASYADQCRLPVLWYRMDEADADPTVFFSNVNRLVRHELRRRLIVFDDVHALPAHAPTHHALAVLCEAMRPVDRCVLLSRAVPPAPFDGLLARQSLHLLKAELLHFDLPETQELAHRVGGERPDATELRTLLALTDGWAAPLAVRLRQRDPLAAVPDDAPVMQEALQMLPLPARERQRLSRFHAERRCRRRLVVPHRSPGGTYFQAARFEASYGPDGLTTVGYGPFEEYAWPAGTTGDPYGVFVPVEGAQVVSTSGFDWGVAPLVPEPATTWVLLAGLGGGVLRR